MKRSDHLGGLSTDERILLEWILESQGIGVRPGFNWQRIQTVVKTKMYFRIPWKREPSTFQ